MNTFKISKQLTSYTVTKKLIEQCEDYFISQAILILNIEEKELKDELSVKIDDGFGLAEFNNIKNESFSKFSDNTTRVSVTLHSRNDDKYIIFRIRFGKDKYWSEIEIDIGHEHPREKAIGMYESIIKIIEPNKTKNNIFHPPSFIDGVLISMSFTSYLAIVFLYLSNYLKTATIFLIPTLLVTLYLFFGKKIRPYSGFDSKSLDNKNKWWDWYSKKILGFIIFTVVLGVIFKDFIMQLFK